MKIYLDACCLNRLFDDQSQPRVRLETEAIALVLEKLSQGEWDWVGSEILLYEINQNPDLENRQRVLSFASLTHKVIDTTEKICNAPRNLMRQALTHMMLSILLLLNLAKLTFS